MKLFDRVELLIDTDTVPHGCRGAVVEVMEPDGCYVEFFDDGDNTIDVLPLDQRDVAVVQLIDRDSVRERLGQLEREARGSKPEPELTLAQYLLAAPRCDELVIEHSRELPRPDPFADSHDDNAEPLQVGPRELTDPLESLARDYAEGRADAAELLGELEAAQSDIGPEDDDAVCHDR